MAMEVEMGYAFAHFPFFVRHIAFSVTDCVFAFESSIAICVMGHASVLFCSYAYECAMKQLWRGVLRLYSTICRAGKLVTFLATLFHFRFHLCNCRLMAKSAICSSAARKGNITVINDIFGDKYVLRYMLSRKSNQKPEELIWDSPPFEHYTCIHLTKYEGKRERKCCQSKTRSESSPNHTYIYSLVLLSNEIVHAELLFNQGKTSKQLKCAECMRF